MQNFNAEIILTKTFKFKKMVKEHFTCMILYPKTLLWVKYRLGWA